MIFSIIKKLKVYTRSGQYLGKVVDVEIDSHSHQVISYMVKPKLDIKNLFKGCLLINYKQVISLSENKMIVDDLIVDKTLQKKPAKC